MVLVHSSFLLVPIKININTVNPIKCGLYTQAFRILDHPLFGQRVVSQKLREAFFNHIVGYYIEMSDKTSQFTFMRELWIDSTTSSDDL